MDAIVLKFISENGVTICLALILLKVLAILTPSVKDDTIVTLFSNTCNSILNVYNSIKEANKNKAEKVAKDIAWHRSD